MPPVPLVTTPLSGTHITPWHPAASSPSPLSAALRSLRDGGAGHRTQPHGARCPCEGLVGVPEPDTPSAACQPLEGTSQLGAVAAPMAGRLPQHHHPPWLRVPSVKGLFFWPPSSHTAGCCRVCLGPVGPAVTALLHQQGPSSPRSTPQPCPRNLRFPSHQRGNLGCQGGSGDTPPAALGCGVRAGRAPRSRAVPRVGTCLQINHPGEQCGRAGNRLRAAPSRRLNIYLSRLCLPVTDRHFQGGARFCSNTRSRALPEASAGNGATKHAGFPGDGGPRVLPGHSTHGTEHPAQR